MTNELCSFLAAVVCVILKPIQYNMTADSVPTMHDLSHSLAHLYRNESHSSKKRRVLSIP